MENLKYAYALHCAMIDYPVINDFPGFYNIDHSNAGYYMDWDKMLKYPAALRIKGMELEPHNLAGLRRQFGTLKDFLGFAKTRGIEKIVAILCRATESHVKAEHGKLKGYFRQIIADAAELGCDYLDLEPAGSYRSAGPLSEEEIRNMASLMAEIGRMSADMGVVTVIHNDFLLLGSMDDQKRFMDMIDPAYMGYNLDTAHLTLMGVDILKFYDEYHEVVKYFHLKDTVKSITAESLPRDAEFAKDGKRCFWEPGSGCVDFKGLYRLLKKHRHKGWMTIETNQTPDMLASLMLSKWYIDNELSPIYK